MQSSPAAIYNVALMRDDIAAKGWLPVDLARKADVSHMSVSRFLSGERQTARMAKKLAAALGYSVRRYLISAKRESTEQSTTGQVAENTGGNHREPTPPFIERRHAEADRRLGGRRRSNRDKYPDRRKEPRR